MGDTTVVHSDLEEFFDQEAWLRRLARRLVTDDSAALDLVQDVWVALIANPPKDRSKPKAWLTAVAHRTAFRHWAARKPRPQSLSAEAWRKISSEGDAPEEAAIRWDAHERLREAVSTLKEPLRTTILLTYQEGLSRDKVAKELGITRRAVRDRLSRASVQLRRILGEDQKGGSAESAWALAVLPLFRRKALARLARLGTTGAKSVSMAALSAAVLAGVLVIALALHSLGTGGRPASGVADLVPLEEDLPRPGDTPVHDDALASRFTARKPVLLEGDGADRLPAPGSSAAPSESDLLTEVASPDPPPFRISGSLTLNDAPPENWKASMVLRGKMMQDPYDLEYRLRPIDSEGRFELGGREPGVWGVYLQPEEDVHGRPMYVVDKQLAWGAESHEVNLDLHTGTVRVDAPDWEKTMLYTQMEDLKCSYSSYAAVRQGQARFWGVPEGFVELTWITSKPGVYPIERQVLAEGWVPRGEELVLTVSPPAKD